MAEWRLPEPERLRCLQPFASLSEGRQAELAGFCRCTTVARGDDPLALPLAGEAALFLLAGELQLRQADGHFRVFVGGCDAALSPLPVSRERGDAARAITDVELLCIDATLLDITLTWDQVGGHTATADAPSMRPVLPIGVLRVESLAHGALSRLPTANINALLHRFERLSLDAGDVVVREGEAGDRFFLIESGRCTVSRQVGGTLMRIADLKAGDSFGEESLVSGEPRNATVTMRTDGVLLGLGQRDFIDLMREPLLKRLSRSEAERRVAAGAVWLDVRFPAECRQDRLPGAINIPLNEIRNAIGPLDARREYVVYCQSGRRSAAAAFILSQHGYRAACLDGGLLATRNAAS